MKSGKVTLVILGFLLIGALGGGLLYAATNHFLNNTTEGSICKTTGTHYSVTIQSDIFSEKQINGRLCDTLTITNADDKVRNIAFGEHDNHEPYNGISEKVLQKDGNFTFTFDKTGRFEVHDHLEDATQTFFTVIN